MKVLIVNPPCRETASPDMPLGLLYVAQSLIEDKHDVKIYDIALQKPSRIDVLNYLKSETFDLMLIGGIVTTYSYVKWVTKEVKKLYPEVPIMAGGFVATPIPHIIFKHTAIDVICCGEGDISVKEYVRVVETKGDIFKVAGLFIKMNDTYFITPKRPLIRNIDTINPPIDAYKLLDIEKYICYSGYRRFNILGGRGCVGNCTFCYRMIPGMRKHSPEYIIRHMEYLIDTYKIDLFHFDDELFVNNKEWIDEFCQQMKEAKLKISFRVNSRADMITDDLCIKLKDVGCIDISVGFETGSQKMLDDMRKRVTLADNCNAIIILKKHNLLSGFNSIQGMPNETKETLMETMRFFEKYKIEKAANYYVTPYPNSEIYKHAIKEGLITDEDEYLELISNSDAGEFKINLTKLSNTDLHYYTQLLRDTSKKNELINNNLSKLSYCKFLIKHYFIVCLYKIGIFGIVWNINYCFEEINRKKHKI